MICSGAARLEDGPRIGVEYKQQGVCRFRSDRPAFRPRRPSDRSGGPSVDPAGRSTHDSSVCEGLLHASQDVPTGHGMAAGIEMPVPTILPTCVAAG